MFQETFWKLYRPTKEASNALLEIKWLQTFPNTLWSGVCVRNSEFSQKDGHQMRQRADVCVAHTLALLLHAPRLGHGETLHDLVLLPSLGVLRVHLVRRPLQHSAVEGVAVSPARFLRPRHAVHWTHRMKTSLDGEETQLFHLMQVHGRAKTKEVRTKKKRGSNVAEQLAGVQLINTRRPP